LQAGRRQSSLDGMDDLAFNRTAPEAGRLERVSPRLRRLVAPNAGPFTFTGTCSYIVGEGDVAIVDPGPDDEGHLARLLDAVRGERVVGIAVTHTHRDHSTGARRLSAETGARTYGEGPHRPAHRAGDEGGATILDASADRDFAPDVRLTDGAALSGRDWTLIAITTPGHSANHLAFSLAEDAVLLSGDHVMAWSTSIVAPPDGDMGDYLASLAKLQGRAEGRFFPGHGGPVEAPQVFLRALLQHRRMREEMIMQAVAAGRDAVPAIVDEVYRGLAPALRPAAALNTLAHLQHLVARDAIRTDGEPTLQSRYRPKRATARPGRE
jgi:glyoxylase-like metal-dependent hydrolase (beta-lactamase superfamily II)